MLIYALEEAPIESLTPICQEMAGKISRLTLFPLLNDLTVYHQFSDNAYLPSKFGGLFMATIVPSFAHEIAHTVEIGIKRITQPDWGISLEYNLAMWSNEKFFAALAREIKVRSIEQYIEPGISQADKIHVRTFNNALWNKELRKRVPCGAFNSYADVIDWGHFIHKTTMRDWNLERIVSEWNKRAEILNNWMESKQPDDQTVCQA